MLIADCRLPTATATATATAKATWTTTDTGMATEKETKHRWRHMERHKTRVSNKCARVDRKNSQIAKLRSPSCLAMLQVAVCAVCSLQLAACNWRLYNWHCRCGKTAAKMGKTCSGATSSSSAYVSAIYIMYLCIYVHVLLLDAAAVASASAKKYFLTLWAATN